MFFAIVVIVSVLMSIGLNVHRYRMLRATGAPMPTSLKVSFIALGVAILGAIVVLVAQVFGL